MVGKVPFDEEKLPEHSLNCFERLFEKCPDFSFNLENDCILAYKSFNNDFDFTAEEFYTKIRKHFDECGY